jgi:hypothetical protein
LDFGRLRTGVDTPSNLCHSYSPKEQVLILTFRMWQSPPRGFKTRVFIHCWYGPGAKKKDLSAIAAKEAEASKAPTAFAWRLGMIDLPGHQNENRR